MALIVGLTGGIGSGKTTVANMFAEEGIPIYIADERAKQIMDRADVVEAVQSIFKENVKIGEVLDRKKIREIVFDNKELLNQLNRIVHPEVKKDFERWKEENDAFPFVIKESAVLFENNLNKQCDLVILVTAPEEVRLARVMARDGVSLDNVESIMRNQLKDSDKIPFSDYVITNINKDLVKKEVKMIINDIIIKI
ncbi:dephospho-CoA kinase [Myroides odoratimimus]|uniref:Dephospho-CoA kinase n=1 Tax=Myroides odoratimimus TaxID=76832 RepID=A0AAI8C534_9FLAO|nr:dephospho-CoA kinase [Myroides odoratimimus]ALU27094.1 dephospho-CoA kinase [Myroides odoratimimus]EPH12431.1 dephospho-CoA kinase [Myroides odoratimimus CCUG 12700]MDM1035798.1 dephospho-CoA kinase [Myroides odoratimimus]MDM1499393.1 dephospho-CoA kinase [Myroides odoratimimus]MDM1512678.1 dephospho-CoA kinase [Myroides odoratimimus]